MGTEAEQRYARAMLFSEIIEMVTWPAYVVTVLVLIVVLGLATALATGLLLLIPFGIVYGAAYNA